MLPASNEHVELKLRRWRPGRGASRLSCDGPDSGHLWLSEKKAFCSCLENPRDRGAWRAAVYGVAQSRTRLKRLSNSGSRAHTVSAATQLNSGTPGMSEQLRASERGCLLIKLFYKLSSQDLIGRPWFAELWNKGNNTVFVRRPWLDVWQGVGTHVVV